MFRTNQADNELSTSEQRKIIGFLRKTLRIREDIYYEILWNTYNVETSRDLSKSQANRLISDMKNKAIGLGVWKPKSCYAFKKERFENLGNRANKMATPQQLRMIESMWTDVSYITNDIARDHAFNKFLKRITGKDGIRFLTKNDISKIKKALDEMKKE